jgi:hypothetical protein
MFNKLFDEQSETHSYSKVCVGAFLLSVCYIALVCIILMKIGICCFSANNAALRRKSKDWLARTQDKVSDWFDMSICELLFQWSSTIKSQLGVLV